MTDVPPRVRRKSRKQRIAEKSDGRCWYCSCELEPDTRTYDHVIPLSRGGASSEENLVLACAICNGNKRNLMLDDYREELGGIRFFGETKGALAGKAREDKDPDWKEAAREERRHRLPAGGQRPTYVNDPRRVTPPQGKGQAPR